MKNKFFHRDNLRNRNINIQFDCILRGYLGELAIKKWLISNNIQIKESNLKLDFDSMDIDLIVLDQNFNELEVEIKTSLIPDYVETKLIRKNISPTILKERINQGIRDLDIKLIKRNKNLEQLKGDIHIQLFFADFRKKKDNFLSLLNINFNEKNKLKLAEEIFMKMKSYSYAKRTFLVGYIDKESLIKQLAKIPEEQQIWSFPNSKRSFYKCNILNNAKNPEELIKFLTLKKESKKNNKLSFS